MEPLERSKGTEAALGNRISPDVCMQITASQQCCPHADQYGSDEIPEKHIFLVGYIGGTHVNFPPGNTACLSVRSATYCTMA